jgi:hypothetical protein
MDQYLALLRTKVLNPSGKYITPADELNALNEAAITVASKLGGLKLVASAVTTANVSDYIFPNSVEGPLYLEIEDTTVTPSTFSRIDVTSYSLFRSLRTEPVFSGTFAWFDPNTKILHVEPAPLLDNLNLRLVYRGLPSEILGGVTTLYDGDVSQMAAITTEAASILRMRTRDMQESEILHNRALQNVEDAGQIEAVRNQTTRVGVGRHTPMSRLKRV